MALPDHCDQLVRHAGVHGIHFTEAVRMLHTDTVTHREPCHTNSRCYAKAEPARVEVDEALFISMWHLEDPEGRKVRGEANNS